MSTTSQTDCINHPGSTINTGYGHVRRNKKSYLAHRFAWINARGEIPDGMCVLHKCDNRLCVNVDHLFLGSRSDNMQDMISKKRDRFNFRIAPPSGEKNANAVLSKCDVLKIKRLRAHGIPRKRIAAMFDCSVPAVDHVIYRQTWR